VLGNLGGSDTWNAGDWGGIALDLTIGNAWVHHNGTYVNGGDPVNNVAPLLYGIQQSDAYRLAVGFYNGALYTNFGANCFHGGFYRPIAPGFCITPPPAGYQFFSNLNPGWTGG